MKSYKVEVAYTAKMDIDRLSDYLVTIMSIEGAWRYTETMRQEIQSLSIFAGLYQPSRSMMLRRIHSQARRMLSHTRRWNYVFHIEDDTVVLDRILPSKMIVI